MFFCQYDQRTMTFSCFMACPLKTEIVFLFFLGKRISEVRLSTRGVYYFLVFQNTTKTVCLKSM